MISNSFKMTSSNVNCRFNLDPPHYDGVQCLSLSGTSLVSGSRDACIKLWDIEQGEQVLINIFFIDCLVWLIALRPGSIFVD